MGEKKRKEGSEINPRLNEVNWNRQPGCISMVRLENLQLRDLRLASHVQRDGTGQGVFAEINGRY